jgi:hypothetical protein
MAERSHLIPITERAAFLARVHVGTTIPLLALCLVPFIARIYVRVWPVWRLGVDDCFMVAGLVTPPSDLCFGMGAATNTSPAVLPVSGLRNSRLGPP